MNNPTQQNTHKQSPLQNKTTTHP